MDSPQRVERTVQALGDGVLDDGRAVVLSVDQNSPTIKVYSTLDRGTTVIDVTLADCADQEDEAAVIVPELIQLGFVPVTDESEDTVVGYKRRFESSTMPTTIAEFCDKAFLALGLPPRAHTRSS